MAFCFQRNVYTAKAFSRWINLQTLDDIYLVFHHCDQNMCFLCSISNFREFAENTLTIAIIAHLWIFDVIWKKNKKFVTFCQFYQLQRCNLLRRKIPRIETCPCRVRIQLWFLVEPLKRISDWCWRTTRILIRSFLSLRPHSVFR